jgi:RNA polymerase sigma-70 factor (ECF subfamily)
VTQDALLLAHRHRASFRGASRYSTWLYRIAATTALMHLRSRRRALHHRALEARDGDAAPRREPVDPALGPVERCDARRRVAALARRIAELGPKYQEVFRLRFVEGLDDREIATRLGLGRSAVKTRTHRARLALRELGG